MTPPASRSLGARRRRALPILLALLLLGGAVPAAAQEPEPTPDPVIAAAGDIACDPGDEYFLEGRGDGAAHCVQQQTSDLLVGRDYAAVIPLGDTQYYDAALWKFQRSYDPSWGRLKAITRPVIGNHEYFWPKAAGYFDYFNGLGAFTGPAGDRDKGYYSYDLGAWHVVALNSVCSQVGGCGPGSPQAEWLERDLAANPRACTLAVWHHPRFVSGGPGWESTQHLWRILYAQGVDVLLNGHKHHYERLAPIDPGGKRDPEYGITQIIVGTGGQHLTRIDGGRLPISEQLNDDTFGILEMTLGAAGYSYRFVPTVEGGYSDAGAATCHGAPPGREAEAVTGPASRVASRGATLNAAIRAGAQSTTYRFEYGPTRRLGSSTPEAPLETPPSGTARHVVADIGDLERRTTYHYRVVATNASGAVRGARRTFTTGRGSAYERLIRASPGVRAYWRLGDVLAAPAFDEVGRNSLVDGSGRLRSTAGVVAGEDGDAAVRFSGDRTSIRVFGPPLAATGTIEGWFRWTSGDAVMRDDSATGGWVLGAVRRGRLAYRIGGTTFTTPVSIDAVRDGTWRHLALVKDGPAHAYYVDGRLVHSGTGASDRPTTMPWHVMRNGPHASFAVGAADEIAVSEAALTGAEIRRRHDVAVAPAAPRTAIVAGPAGPTALDRPRFSFASSDRRARFRCALAAEGARLRPAPCAATRRLRRLDDGAYTFAVYAVDRDGYPDATPARRRFTVDTARPQVTLTPPPLPTSLDAALVDGVVSTVGCSETCAVTARVLLDSALARRLRLPARTTVAGETRASVDAAGPRQVGVRFTPDVRRRLLRRGTTALNATLQVRFRDPAGNARTRRLPLRLAPAVAPPSPTPTPTPAPPPPAPPAPSDGG